MRTVKVLLKPFSKIGFLKTCCIFAEHKTIKQKIMSQVKFLEKQTRLQTALTKVQTKLASFKEIAETQFHNVYETLSEEKRDEWRALFYSWNWNDWHALEDRLTDRINDNTSDYNDWHYNAKGWVAL